jgi:O-antigen ligase
MNENSPSLVSHKKEKIFHGDYSKLFTAAYFVSSKNNFLGSGHKSFMTECLRLNEKNISCNNHPHNIYLEVLVNLGIFGVFILTIILFLIINNIIQFLLKKNLDENHKITLIIFLVFLICEFIPIRSFGSIFTTINGYIFWFLLALLSSLNPKKLLIRKVITHDL